MSSLITWNEDGVDVATFTIPPDAEAALESYRVSQGQYATIREMVVAAIVQHVVAPAMLAFPPPDLAPIKQQAEDAARALQIAQTQKITSGITEL